MVLMIVKWYQYDIVNYHRYQYYIMSWTYLNPCQPQEPARKKMQLWDYIAARKQEFWSKYRTCIWIQMPIISAYCIILNMIILDKQRYQLSFFNLFWVRCKKNHDKIQLNYFVFQTGTVKMEWLGIQRFQIYSEQRWTGWIHRRQVI